MGAERVLPWVGGPSLSSAHWGGATQCEEPLLPKVRCLRFFLGRGGDAVMQHPFPVRGSAMPAPGPEPRHFAGRSQLRYVLALRMAQGFGVPVEQIVALPPEDAQNGSA